MKSQRWVVAQHNGLFRSPFSHGPNLVQATFPDGQRRLAWYYVAILDDSGATLLGPAAVVYLDALTGEPLTLGTDAVVGDPQMVCGFEVDLTPSLGRLWALILLIIYLLVVATVIGLVWIGRHIREGLEQH